MKSINFFLFEEMMREDGDTRVTESKKRTKMKKRKENEEGGTKGKITFWGKDIFER